MSLLGSGLLSKLEEQGHEAFDWPKETFTPVERYPD